MRILSPLVFLLAAPALAQDGSLPADPATSTFNGVHVDGIGGWDRDQTQGRHRDGALYGIGAGYDIRRGNLVAGLEGEASDSTAKVCAGATTVASPSLCARAGRDLYAGARIGTVVGDKVLVYAKAGYTNGRYKLVSDDGIGDVTLAHRDLNGGRVGAGVEYAIAPNLSVKTEYRYSNYQDGITRHQVVGGIGLRF